MKNQIAGLNDVIEKITTDLQSNIEIEEDIVDVRMDTDLISVDEKNIHDNAIRIQENLRALMQMMSG